MPTASRVPSPPPPPPASCNCLPSPMGRSAALPTIYRRPAAAARHAGALQPLALAAAAAGPCSARVCSARRGAAAAPSLSPFHIPSAPAQLVNLVNAYFGPVMTDGDYKKMAEVLEPTISHKDMVGGGLGCRVMDGRLRGSGGGCRGAAAAWRRQRGGGGRSCCNPQKRGRRAACSIRHPVAHARPCTPASTTNLTHACTPPHAIPQVRNIGRVGIQEYEAYLRDLHQKYPGAPATAPGTARPCSGPDLALRCAALLALGVLLVRVSAGWTWRRRRAWRRAARTHLLPAACRLPPPATCRLLCAAHPVWHRRLALHVCLL